MSEDIQLEPDAADLVRRMLIVGLSAYGELERVRNQAEIFAAQLPHESLKPLHVTGDACTISKFADALIYMTPYREPV